MSLRDGKTGQTETLTCTPEHPLFVSGRGWVAAGSLGIGTSIVSRAGPLLSVSGLTWEREAAGSAGQADADGKPDIDAKPYTVYNLTVEGDHTYFVGSLGGGTWVHNGCRGSGDYIEPTRYRRSTRPDVWNNASEASEDGVVRDPESGEAVDPNNWHMGHRPGYEFRKLLDTAQQEGWSRQKFLDAYNDASKYRPETPETSVSHVGEAGADVNNWPGY